jgi:hypothetical protein
VVKTKPGIIQSWVPVRIALVLAVWFVIVLVGGYAMTKRGVSPVIVVAVMGLGGYVVGLWVEHERRRSRKISDDEVVLWDGEYTTWGELSQNERMSCVRCAGKLTGGNPF